MFWTIRHFLSRITLALGDQCQHFLVKNQPYIWYIFWNRKNGVTILPFTPWHEYLSSCVQTSSACHGWVICWETVTRSWVMNHKIVKNWSITLSCICFKVKIKWKCQQMSTVPTGRLQLAIGAFSSPSPSYLPCGHTAEIQWWPNNETCLPVYGPYQVLEQIGTAGLQHTSQIFLPQPTCTHPSCFLVQKEVGLCMGRIHQYSYGHALPNHFQK